VQEGFVQIEHPETGGVAEVHAEAYEDVFKSKGWRLKSELDEARGVAASAPPDTVTAQGVDTSVTTATGEPADHAAQEEATRAAEAHAAQLEAERLEAEAATAAAEADSVTPPEKPKRGH